MDLTIPQASLARALRTVGRAVPSKVTLPILRAVLLHAARGALTLRATDLELGVVTTTPAEVSVPGTVAIPARLLGEYAAQLPGDTVRLRLDDGNRVQATCGRYTANLATMSADDFPELPSGDSGIALDVAAGMLREGITRVAFAAARDDTRPVLRAVLFDIGAEGLTLAAADGFRLARAHVPAPGAPPQQLLVPARAVAEFGRLLTDVEAARLTFREDARTLHLAVGDTSLFAQLAEGRFPDLDQVIPRGWATRVTVDTATFRQAVRVAGIFGSNGHTGEARPMALDPVPDHLRLHARGDETGDAETELPATVEGEAQAIVLDTRLVADLADVASAPRLELAWKSPTAPVVIRERQPAETADAGRSRGDDARNVWVVMPLSVSAVAEATASGPAPATPPQAVGVAPAADLPQAA